MLQHNASVDMMRTHHTAALVAGWRGHFCCCVEGVAVRAGPALIFPGGDVGVTAGGLQHNATGGIAGPVSEHNHPIYAADAMHAQHLFRRLSEDMLDT
jgi:hypothetical protein